LFPFRFVIGLRSSVDSFRRTRARVQGMRARTEVYRAGAAAEPSRGPFWTIIVSGPTPRRRRFLRSPCGLPPRAGVLPLLRHFLLMPTCMDIKLSW